MDNDAAQPARYDHASLVDRDLYRAVDEQLALVQPAHLLDADALLGSGQDSMSPEDADTLFAASHLLQMLVQADLTSFADVDRIRRIAEYDDILNRLAAARGRLAPAERSLAMAAEAVLLRL